MVERFTFYLYFCWVGNPKMSRGMFFQKLGKLHGNCRLEQGFTETSWMAMFGEFPWAWRPCWPPNNQTCKLAKGAEEVWNLFFMPAFQKAFELQLFVWSPQQMGTTESGLSLMYSWCESVLWLHSWSPYLTPLSKDEMSKQTGWNIFP